MRCFCMKGDNMETSKNSFLKDEPVLRLMGKYAVPCIISLLVGALYNIVDQIWKSNPQDAGRSMGNTIKLCRECFLLK